MTHYRPIAMPNMAEPVPIADQPSPMLQVQQNRKIQQQKWHALSRMH